MCPSILRICCFTAPLQYQGHFLLRFAQGLLLLEAKLSSAIRRTRHWHLATEKGGEEEGAKWGRAPGADPWEAKFLASARTLLLFTPGLTGPYTLCPLKHGSQLGFHSSDMGSGADGCFTVPYFSVLNNYLVCLYLAPDQAITSELSLNALCVAGLQERIYFFFPWQSSPKNSLVLYIRPGCNELV